MGTYLEIKIDLLSSGHIDELKLSKNFSYCNKDTTIGETLNTIYKLFYEAQGSPISTIDIVYRLYRFEKAERYYEKVVKRHLSSLIKTSKDNNNPATLHKKFSIYPSALVLKSTKGDIYDCTLVDGFYDVLENISEMVTLNICAESPKLKDFLERYSKEDHEYVVKFLIELAKDGFSCNSQSELESAILQPLSINKHLNDIINKKSEIDISEAYTELTAKEILPITLEFRNEGSNKEEEYKVLELVKKENKLVISGESGSGKTTTLKWLNATCAKNWLENSNGYVPLYIELNTYTRGSFFDYIKIKINRDTILGKNLENREIILEDILKKILKNKAILFLDGFDLLSSKDDFDPYNEISNFISEYNNCRFVISSRPSFVNYIDSDFKVSELKKLTDERIQIFIEKYVTDRELRYILINRILGNEQLKSLLKNPMMLYLALKVATEKKGDKEDLLPASRSELYNAFVAGLFFFEKKKGKTFCADQAQIKNALTDLYFKLQCWNKVACEYDKALDIVQEHAKGPRFRKITAQDILKDSCRLGVLTKIDSDIEDTKIQYGIHQSFQEYFAAIKLKELFEKGFDVSKTFSHPKWEEVVIFTSEMLDSGSIDKFIDSMLSKGELFLASKCVNKASEETKEKLCVMLAEKMDSKYELEKINSIESLGRIGNLGVSILAKAMKYEDYPIDYIATWTLGEIGSETAVQTLVNALEDEDEDWAVRRDAATALRNVRSEVAVQTLINVLEDEDEILRRIAVESLGNIGYEAAVSALINTLQDEDWPVQSEAAEALGKIESKIGLSEAAIQEIIELLENKDKSEDVRDAATWALREIRSETAVQKLINLLDNKDEYILERAIRTLGDIGSETAIQALINRERREKRRYFKRRYFRGRRGRGRKERRRDASKSKDKWVRVEVIKALGSTGSEVAVQELINSLEDNNEYVRSEVAISLGSIGSEAAIRALINALKDKDKSVRREVAKALGNAGSQTAVQELIKALEDDNEYVRNEVAISLGNIGSEAAVEQLIDLLENRDKDVRKRAVKALGNIGSEAAVQPLINALENEEDELVRREVADSLGNIGSEAAVPALINALKSGNVEFYVAEALKKIKSEKKIRLLISELKYRNVRWRVAEALENIKSEEVTKILLNALKNGEVWWHSVEIFKKICDFKDKKSLQDLLESEHELLYNAAFEILSEMETEERSKVILVEAEGKLLKL